MYSSTWTSFTFSQSAWQKSREVLWTEEIILTHFLQFEFPRLQSYKPSSSRPSSEDKPSQVLCSSLSGHWSQDGRAHNCLWRLGLPWVPCSNETLKHATKFLHLKCCDYTWIQNNLKPGKINKRPSQLSIIHL